MKSIPALTLFLALLSASVAVAQTPPPAPITRSVPQLEPEVPGFEGPEFSPFLSRRLRAAAALASPGRVNEIKVRGRAYSGILVQAAKSKNLLQMVNPFAPARYGSGWDNITQNVTDGRIIGLKVFAVSY